ncbi:MAG: sporulation protein YabP [Ruminococcaceae bacterium]|nr:sporulation protein YabP [Oscillospiraceae bacterium]
MAVTENIKQNLTLLNRKELKITGVNDIDSFSENKVVLNTALGELVVHGEELHIIELVTETGDLAMTGKINSLCYNKFSSNASLIKRIFR